jgi:hypothetical protein
MALAMKVAFTTREYARLLELVHLGLTVAGSRTDEPESMPERYAGISQKIFELADACGCADLVDTDFTGRLFASEKLESGPAREKLDAFMDENFWNELAARLAERDLRAELGPRDEGTLFTSDEEERLAGFEEGYWREFETNGVDHVQVLKGGQG